MNDNEKPLDAPVISEEDQRFANKVKKYLQAAQNYKTSRGFHERWAEYQRFWEADQWPQATPKTENYPRPCTNHFAEIIDMKTSGLTYEKPDIYFEPIEGAKGRHQPIEVAPLEDPNEEPENFALPGEGEPPQEEKETFKITPAELLVTMVEKVADHVDLEGLLENMTRSASLLGNGISYHYWNNNILGGSKDAAYIGEIEAMEIDVSDFYPGNPAEIDIQKQPWIIVTEERPLKEVKQEYSEFSDMVDYLQAEKRSTSSMVYDHERQDMNVTENVELIHYWEKNIDDEEVTVGDKKTKRKIPQIDYYVVCQGKVIRKEEDFYESKLYPFAGFPWYPKRKSFFGKAESVDIINNQKELNRLQGIGLLGIYQTGLPNIRFKKHFVKKENIPVGPGGGVIEDDTPPGQGWGVDYMQPPSVAPLAPVLKDALSQGMKDTTGVHEAWTGKAPSAHLNASAIMALQEAAGIRIRPIQRRMYRAVRDIGRIWLGYMKQYYTEDRLYKVFGKDNVEGVAWFKSAEFKELEFEVKVAVSTSSPYSKTVIAATLDNMVQNGLIDGELYLRMLPPEIFPKVTELLELIEERKQEQQQVVLQQQMTVVDEVVTQVITQAREQGVEVTPDALNQMMELIQQRSKEIDV